MQKANFGSAVRHLFLMAVLALAMIAVPALAQKAERPNVKVGDRWLFTVNSGLGSVANRVWVVTSVATAGIEGTEDGQALLLTPDLNVLESPRIEHSNNKRLNFPLEVGKQWSYSNDYVLKTVQVEGHINVHVMVVGYEKVRVSAGEFDAFKLQRTGTWWLSNGGNGKTTETYWYAPAARTIVKAEYRTALMPEATTDLAAFTLRR